MAWKIAYDLIRHLQAYAACQVNNFRQLNTQIASYMGNEGADWLSHGGAEWPSGQSAIGQRRELAVGATVLTNKKERKTAGLAQGAKHGPSTNMHVQMSRGKPCP